MKDKLSSKYWRRLFVGILLGIISFVVIFFLSSLELFDVLEFKLKDFCYRLRINHTVNPLLKVIAIDDYSIEHLGRWPWKRTLHAALFDALSDVPPGVVGYDILFSEKSDYDLLLATNTDLLGNIVYAGFLRERDSKIISPTESLAEVSKMGFINAPSDLDGVVRKIPLVFKVKEKVYPSLCLQVLCVYFDLDFSAVDIIWGDSIIIPCRDNIRIPIDENGCMIINYVGGLGVFEAYNFLDVLKERKNASGLLKRFNKKILLVGLSATGTTDVGTIPVETNVPLIAVHANALNTILNRDFFVGVGYVINMLVLLSLIVFSVFINAIYKSTKAAVWSLLLLVIYIVTNISFFMNNVLIDLLAPVLGVVIPFVLITVYRYGWVERHSKWVKKVFSHYLAKDVIAEILESPDKLSLGGQLRQATVLFLDLRNFTTFSEAHTPQEVVGLLNKCFDWITDIILKHGGLLDKYIGDEVMAVVGAPAIMPVNEQAQRAVDIALEIEQKWGDWSKREGITMGIGIGINTGNMVVGNMGSKNIFNYTVIGDEVNIARRVQGLTRQYDTNIIITQSVYEYVKDRVNAKDLGSVNVKGRKEPVEIYGIGL